MESRLEISTGDLVEGAVCSPDNMWIMMVNSLIQQAVWNFAADGNRSYEVGSFTEIIILLSSNEDTGSLPSYQGRRMTYDLPPILVRSRVSERKNMAQLSSKVTLPKI